jgi:hypothetical protein
MAANIRVHRKTAIVITRDWVRTWIAVRTTRYGIPIAVDQAACAIIVTRAPRYIDAGRRQVVPIALLQSRIIRAVRTAIH